MSYGWDVIPYFPEDNRCGHYPWLVIGVRIASGIKVSKALFPSADRSLCPRLTVMSTPHSSPQNYCLIGGGVCDVELEKNV